jgi:hypothetical protein
MGFGCEIEPFTLTVFHPFTPDEPPIVRKAVWQRMPDLRRLHEQVEAHQKVMGFEPSFIIKDATLPADELDALLRSGLHLSLPPHQAE